MVKLRYIPGGNATAVLKNGSDRVFVDVVNGECELDEEVADRLLAHTVYGTSFELVKVSKPTKPEVVDE